MIRKKLISRAAILIDWSNACSMSTIPSYSIPESRYIKQILLEVQSRCARILSNIDGSTNYSCYTKIYHGWHTKRLSTPTRRSFETLVEDKIFKSDLARRFNRVIFLPEIAMSDKIYGDTTYGTLYNTIRSQGQKMVDTALACDAIAMQASGFVDSVIIVSDDDDFVPVLVCCEALGYKTFLLRKKNRTLVDVCDNEDCKMIEHWM